MNLFLTSEIGATINKDGARLPGKINNSNGFLSQFQDCVKGRGRMLYISSTPAENDKVKDWFENTRVSLENEGIRFTECLLINGRNAGSLNALVPGADVIFLSGGHLPTQNDFFQQIGLGEILSQYEGTIVAQSAGSMNCAGTVYVCPELPGESLDPNFQRFRPGLGLTELNIIPHFNTNANAWLDGKRFYWEIIRPDSFQVPLYVLPDGSHFYCHGGRTELFGEGYRFYRGRFERISRKMDG